MLSRNVHGQDVTERFFDLKIRLDNAEKVRKRLLALLEKATNVKDSVAVERELGRVTEQIERFKGQLKFLRDRIAYSTITLRVHKRTPWGPAPAASPFPGCGSSAWIPSSAPAGIARAGDSDVQKQNRR